MLFRSIGAVKIKTIGDAYLAVTGLPDYDPDHAEKIAALALRFRTEIKRFADESKYPLQVRIGIHTGPVVAGIIGRTTSHFDLWGDSVNTAARLEATCPPGAIQVSADLAKALQDRFLFTDRGSVELKGKGPTRTFLLEAAKANEAQEAAPRAA